MNLTNEKVRLHVKVLLTIISITALFGGIIYGLSVYSEIERREEAKKQAIYHLAWCTPVRDFLTEKFDLFDSNKDGLLNDEELNAASTALGDKDSKYMLDYARNSISRVGHATGTTSYLEQWLIPNGHGMYSLRRVYSKVYGISKDDLSTYPDRIKAEFGNQN